jgi:hypothetical protein
MSNLDNWVNRNRVGVAYFVGVVITASAILLSTLMEGETEDAARLEVYDEAVTHEQIRASRTSAATHADASQPA